MKIVEVRFIKDSQNVHTGWEFYSVGMTAHFYAGHADALVEVGRAVTSDPPEVEKPKTPPAQLEVEKPDYSGLTVKDLKLAMFEAGIPFTAKMRKADLITALEEHDNE